MRIEWSVSMVFVAIKINKIELYQEKTHYVVKTIVLVLDDFTHKDIRTQQNDFCEINL